MTRAIFNCILSSVMFIIPMTNGQFHDILAQEEPYQAYQFYQALPEVEIFAPEKVKNGYMVVVTAKMDKSKIPANLVYTNYQWTVLVNGVPSKNFLVWPDGNQIVFGASEENSVTTVILDIDYLFGVQKTVKIADKDTKVFSDVSIKSPELSSTSIIVGDTPNPGPNPNPLPPGPGPIPPGPPVPPGPGPPVPPSPSPVLPAGRFDLANFAYQTMVSQSSLTPQLKVALAGEYASALSGIAAQIVALPNYRDVATILKDTSVKNQEARAKAGVSDIQVADFNKVFNDKIYDYYAVKKTLRTAQDIADAWREMAAGFTAYVSNPK